MDKKTSLIVTALFVGIVLGAGLWAYIGGGNTIVDNDAKGVNAEYEALKQAVRQQYFEYFDEAMEASPSGVVEGVTGNSIVFKTYIPEVVLLASDLTEEKEIFIDENTKMVKETEKDGAAYAREIAEYDTAIAEYAAEYQGRLVAPSEAEEFNFAEPLYPSSMLQQEILLSDVNVGDFISINRQQDEPADSLDNPSTKAVVTTITIQESVDMNTEDIDILDEVDSEGSAGFP